MAELKFFKGALNDEQLAKVVVGSIWFDTAEKTIKVCTKVEGGIEWEPYAGELKSIEWKDEKLVVSKYDGSSVELDFSAVATDADVAELAATVASNKTAAETGINEAKAAAKAADDKAVAAQGAIDAYVESNDARVKAVEDDLAGYKTSNDERVKAVEDRADALEATVNEDHEGRIEALEARFEGEGSVEDQIEDAVKEAVDALTAEIAKKVDQTAYDEKMGKLDAKDQALTEALASEAATARAAEEANAAAAAAAQSTADGAASEAARAHTRIDALIEGEGINPDIIESFKELNDYLADHEDVKEGILDAIEANGAAISALQGQVGEGTVDERIAAAREELVGIIEENEEVTAAALTDLDERMKGLEAVNSEERLSTVENKVAALETAVNDTLPEAIADAKKAGTDAAAALEAYKGTNDVAVAAALKAGQDAQKFAEDLKDNEVKTNADNIAANTAAIEALQSQVTNGLSWAYFG